MKNEFVSIKEGVNSCQVCLLLRYRSICPHCRIACCRMVHQGNRHAGQRGHLHVDHLLSGAGGMRGGNDALGM